VYNIIDEIYQKHSGGLLQQDYLLDFDQHDGVAQSWKEATCI
jgi:hypothetical protein